MKRLMLLAVLSLAACSGGAPPAGGNTPAPATPLVTPVPAGQIIFGASIDSSTMTVLTPVTTVATTEPLGWIAYLSDAANTTSLTITVASVGAGGAESMVTTTSVAVANPADNELAHTEDATLAASLGAGTFAFRYIRPSDGKVLAEGTVTITP